MNIQIKIENLTVYIIHYKLLNQSTHKMSCAKISPEKFNEHMKNVCLEHARKDYARAIDIANQERLKGNTQWSSMIMASAISYYSLRLKDVADGVCL